MSNADPLLAALPEDEPIGFPVDAAISKTVNDFFKAQNQPKPAENIGARVSPFPKPKPGSEPISTTKGLVIGSDLSPVDHTVHLTLRKAFGNPTDVKAIVDAANTVFCIQPDLQNDRKKPEPGTGFLLKCHNLEANGPPKVEGSPLYLLMTNNHVIDKPDAAASNVVHLIFHPPDEPERKYQKEFTFVPHRFFMSSVDLDYTVCGVQIDIPNDHPLSGKLRQLSLRDHTAAAGSEYAIVIQYPGLKGIANRDKRIAFGKIEPNQPGEKPRFMYFTSADHGSSGSPVLNEHGQLIGLHNVAGNTARKPPGSIGMYSDDNGGVRMSAIVQDMRKRSLPETNEPAYKGGPALSAGMKTHLRSFL